MKILRSADKNRYPALFQQMFLGRARVFHDRLAWDVKVEDGLEIDIYDKRHDPVYIVNDDESGQVHGSLRLLPTTGATMMGQEFRDFFSKPVQMVHPQIWECTRFCVHNPSGVRNSAAVQLLIALHNLCSHCDIRHIIGVYELSMERVYARIGWEPSCYAMAKPAYSHIRAGIWTVDSHSLLRMEQHLTRHRDARKQMSRCSPEPEVVCAAS